MTFERTCRRLAVKLAFKKDETKSRRGGKRE